MRNKRKTNKNTRYPNCCICGKPLNNNDGPSKRGSRGNNVIRICRPNTTHFVHRGCAIHWRNLPAVNVLKQMGKKNKCPTCFVERLTNLETVTKVVDTEILRKTRKNKNTK